MILYGFCNDDGLSGSCRQKYWCWGGTTGFDHDVDLDDDNDDVDRDYDGDLDDDDGDLGGEFDDDGVGNFRCATLTQ